MRIERLPPSAHEFLRGTRLAVIAETATPAPHAVPVWFDWDGEAIEFFTRPNRPKVARLQAAPEITVLVSAEVAEPVYWVRIEGVATLHDDAAELVERLCGRYLDLADPAHRQLDADIRAMRHERSGSGSSPNGSFTSRVSASSPARRGRRPAPRDQRLEPFGAHCVGNAAPRVVVA